MGKIFHAYKLVLAAQSPVFRNEFFFVRFEWRKMIAIGGSDGKHYVKGRPNAVKRHKKMNSWLFKGPSKLA